MFEVVYDKQDGSGFLVTIISFYAVRQIFFKKKPLLLLKRKRFTTVKPNLEYNSRNCCACLPCCGQLGAHFLQDGISTERSKTFHQ